MDLNKSNQIDRNIVADLILGKAGTISSGLTQNFKDGISTFRVTHDDGCQYVVTIQFLDQKEPTKWRL